MVESMKSGRPGEGGQTPPAEPESPSVLIDANIKELGDWRGGTLAHVRSLIKQAVPDVVEEVKWRKPSNSMLGVPVWSCYGIICTGETYKDKVKLTFAEGADIDDPTGIFNAGLGGNTRRAIDLYQADEIDEVAFKALCRAAAALNASKVKRTVVAGRGFTSAESPPAPAEPKLLSGGNPQIPKGDGDAPVQSYISAMPGWKHDVGRRLDLIIERAVPNVRKAVRWNSPFYGIEDQGWFLSFHCFTKYIKVSFLNGALLLPVPPVESKEKDVRYFHIHEGDELDEVQLAAWVTQGAGLPGNSLF